MTAPAVPSVGAGGAPVTRRRLRITGLVQGVGFRPFVVGCAVRCGVVGVVKNVGASVVVEVAGPDAAVAAFVAAVVVGPAAARVDAVAELAPGDAPPGRHFVIGAGEAHDTPDAPDAPDAPDDDDDDGGPAPSSTQKRSLARGPGPSSMQGRESERGASDVPLDRAPCAACVADLFDDEGRRAGHAFVSCVACGPRFTLLEALPWDRDRTTLRGFALCAACAAEHADVFDRRCHSETQCCPQCGPRLSGSVADVVRALRAGAIVALKGVGGYHLCCDAGRDDVVRRLRRRKSRPDKPLAVMVRDLAAARALAEVDDIAAAALSSPAAPIVVLRRRGATADSVSPSVAAGATLGLMLPSSPLHHLLLRAVDAPLVMTSGNRSEEPLVVDDAEAEAVLGPIADAFLHHDRPIRHGVDDSVVRVIDGAPRVWRRGRGLAPSTLRLPAWASSSSTVLALGAHQKSSFAIGLGTTGPRGRAIVSPHVGDLDAPRAVARLRESIARHLDLYGAVVDVVACDAHPDYASSEVAASFGLPIERVQHHRAHAAALLVEHGHDEDAVVVVCDGSGLGDDGALWGGEVFVGDERAAHLPYVRLPGGEAAARQPWRSATAWLHAAGIVDDDDLLPQVPRADRRLARALIDKQTHAPQTSSLGRLFDAVACLCGLPAATGDASFSGAAAIALEDAALEDAALDDGALDDGALDDADRDGAAYDFDDVIAAVVRDVRAGVGAAVISARFHDAVVRWLATTASQLARSRALTTIGLSGGCFMNTRLLTGLGRRLRRDGFRVLGHVDVPTNDGGIALGQLAVAARRRRAAG